MVQESIKSHEQSNVGQSVVNVTEIIKTFEDACNVLGDEHPLVIQYRLNAGAFGGDPQTEDFLAYLKLRIIAAALNKFAEGTERWYPWFYLYTKEEIERLGEDPKTRVMPWDDVSIIGASCVRACMASYCQWSGTYALVSSHLAVKSEELASYFGKQFINIWKDYVVCLPQTADNKK